MSDVLISSLNERLSRLERENSELRSEAKKYRLAKKEVQTELDTVRATLATIETERDQAKAQAATAPDDWRKKYEATQAELRTRDHRDAWAAALNGQLAPGFKVDHVWREIDYKPGEAVPTPEQIGDHVAQVRENVPGLFAEPAQTSQKPPAGATRGTVPATPPPAVSGRGGPDSPSGRFVVTRDNMRDSAWMAQNQGRLAEAKKNGTLDYRP